MGAEVVGISVDSHFTHAAYAQRLKLRFPLLSDLNRRVGPDLVGSYSSVSEGYAGLAKRSVLVVSPDKIVSWMWVSDDPGGTPDTEEVREAVQEVFHRWT